MKKYRMSFADAINHIPAHPERTARQEGTGMNFDVTFQEWPNRASMMKTIDMQERSGSNYMKWRAIRLPNPLYPMTRKRRRNPYREREHASVVPVPWTDKERRETDMALQRRQFREAAELHRQGGNRAGRAEMLKWARYYGNLMRKNPVHKHQWKADQHRATAMLLRGAAEYNKGYRTTHPEWYDRKGHAWQLLRARDLRKKAADLLRKNPAYTAAALRSGTRHEMEHAHLFPRRTRSAMIRRIAQDHLKESPNYYTALSKMEAGLRKNPSGIAIRLVPHGGEYFVDYKVAPNTWKNWQVFRTYALALEGKRKLFTMLMKQARHK